MMLTRHDVQRFARESRAFQHWMAGYGPIRHSERTALKVLRMARALVEQGIQAHEDRVLEQLAALDRLTCAGLWLVAHMTYARRVRLDGQPLQANDFKVTPEGHTGGALNMVPGYAAYLTLNALTGTTRSWMMGQGHCVAAIDALNVLTNNLHPEQGERYAFSEEGLSCLVNDFYAYAQTSDGHPAAPLGSHVNPHTAGGISEGGYLGFAELQYVHLPEPGETLIAFLSDGAAEEQRGSDWAPRWWRAEDCGLALPVMIANGRRIEQRTELGTREGLEGFRQHLRNCGFEPFSFDGRDPAAFVCALFDMESVLRARAQAVQIGALRYPVRMPYAIAETDKGWGFYGAGENAAHNLPLPASPALDDHARALFTEHAARLYVPTDELKAAINLLSNHVDHGRVLERDHTLALRNPPEPRIPAVPWQDTPCSPMLAIDRFFAELVEANPGLRARVGNPDELASNRLSGVLQALRHRVSDPEQPTEAVLGRVVTALNEEAVVSACLANKNGLNLVASYEAFTVKMLGAIRQELIFARNQKVAGRPARWLGFPVVATSHTWENGKNEHSHQDTTFCEALLGEMNDVSRVLFPADYNSTLALLPDIYKDRGVIACLVVPKRDRPCHITPDMAQRLAEDGATRLGQREHTSSTHRISLIANGSYQLGEALRVAERLDAHGVSWSLTYLQEPGRFRVARDSIEVGMLADDDVRDSLFGDMACCVVFTHMRPEVLRGHLHPLLSGPGTSVLGYLNRGGTLDEPGMLFANRSTWAHGLLAAAQSLGVPPGEWLNADELDAALGNGDPSALR